MKGILIIIFGLLLRCYVDAYDANEAIKLMKAFTNFTAPANDALTKVALSEALVGPLVQHAYSYGSHILQIAKKSLRPKVRMMHAMKLSHTEMLAKFYEMKRKQSHISSTTFGKLRMNSYKKDVSAPLKLLETAYILMLADFGNASTDSVRLFKDVCNCSPPQKIIAYMHNNLFAQCTLRASEIEEQRAEQFAKFWEYIGEMNKLLVERKSKYAALKFRAYARLGTANTTFELIAFLDELNNTRHHSSAQISRLKPRQVITKIARLFKKVIKERANSSHDAKSCFFDYFIEYIHYDRRPLYETLEYLYLDIAKTLLFAGICNGVKVTNQRNSDAIIGTLRAPMETAMKMISKYIPHKLNFSLHAEKSLITSTIDKFTGDYRLIDPEQDEHLINTIQSELKHYGSDIYEKQFFLTNTFGSILFFEKVCDIPSCINVSMASVHIVVTRSLRNETTLRSEAATRFAENEANIIKTLEGDGTYYTAKDMLSYVLKQYPQLSRAFRVKVALKAVVDCEGKCDYLLRNISLCKPSCYRAMRITKHSRKRDNSYDMHEILFMY